GDNVEASFSPSAGGGFQGEAERCPLHSQSAARADGGNETAARFAGALCRQRARGRAQSQRRPGVSRVPHTFANVRGFILSRIFRNESQFDPNPDPSVAPGSPSPS